MSLVLIFFLLYDDDASVKVSAARKFPFDIKILVCCYIKCWFWFFLCFSRRYEYIKRYKLWVWRSTLSQHFFAWITTHFSAIHQVMVNKPTPAPKRGKQQQQKHFCYELNERSQFSSRLEGKAKKKKPYGTRLLTKTTNLIFPKEMWQTEYTLLTPHAKKSQ